MRMFTIWQRQTSGTSFSYAEATAIRGLSPPTNAILMVAVPLIYRGLDKLIRDGNYHQEASLFTDSLLDIFHLVFVYCNGLMADCGQTSGKHIAYCPSIMRSESLPFVDILCFAIPFFSQYRIYYF